MPVGLKLCRLLVILCSVSSLGQGAAEKRIVVRVDAAHPMAPHHGAWNYFGADEPNYSYAPNGQKLLRELSELSPAPVYIRLHNLLSTGDGSASLKWGSTNVYTEAANGSPVYDWTITDKIFDALTRNGTRPIVQAGFMPEALSTHPQPYRHPFPKGEIFTGWSYPPKDYAKWQALITAWATHLRERYGAAAVDTWLWEVWNEPDIAYWHGSPEEYDKLYDYTAAGIQAALPNAKVGGPEVTGVTAGRSEAFLRQFLEHCERGTNSATGGTGAPLAFISFHPKGAPKFADGHVRMGISQQLQSVDRGMQVVASYPRWKATPIILGESDPEGCAACGGPQNGYRNGTLYGVSIAEATQRIAELAKRNGVMLQAAVNWAFEFEDEPIFQGFRELATGGVDKPVLNTFRILGMLSGAGAKELRVTSSGALPLAQVLAEGVRDQPDVDAVATISGRQIDVMLWNYHDDDVASAPAEVALDILGMPAATRKRIAVQQFLVDQEHGNSFTAWKRMGSPQLPTREQQAELERASRLEAIGPKTILDRRPDGQAKLTLTLARQAVMLVRLTW